MELLINSVGFFAVVLGVIGFYSGILILAWQRLRQIRRGIRIGDMTPHGQMMSKREAARLFWKTDTPLHFDFEDRRR